MIDINLIPVGSAPKSSAIQTASNLKIAATIGTIVFVFATIVMIAIFVIDSSAVKASTAKQEQLKSQIKSLQKEETQYVLVKDRASKIKEILDTKGIEKEMDGFESLVLSLPPEAQFTESDITNNKTEASFTITSSSSLTALFATVVSSQFYTGVVMSSFSFDSDRGYQTTFMLTNQ